MLSLRSHRAGRCRDEVGVWAWRALGSSEASLTVGIGVRSANMSAIFQYGPSEGRDHGNGEVDLRFSTICNQTTDTGYVSYVSTTRMHGEGGTSVRKGPGLKAGPADVGMTALRWNKILLNRTVVVRSCETDGVVELVNHEARKRRRWWATISRRRKETDANWPAFASWHGAVKVAGEVMGQGKGKEMCEVLGRSIG